VDSVEVPPSAQTAASGCPRSFCWSERLGLPRPADYDKERKTMSDHDWTIEITPNSAYRDLA